MMANNVGGGQIAGTAEAGDDPPVNKKKKKGEPTIIARGCMPGARNRFKGGVELLSLIFLKWLHLHPYYRPLLSIFTSSIFIFFNSCKKICTYFKSCSRTR